MSWQDPRGENLTFLLSSTALSPVLDNKKVKFSGRVRHSRRMIKVYVVVDIQFGLAVGSEESRTSAIHSEGSPKLLQYLQIGTQSGRLFVSVDGEDNCLSRLIENHDHFRNSVIADSPIAECVRPLYI